MYHEYSTTHAPEPAAARCWRCGHTAPPSLSPGAGPHYAAARCAACAAFLRWLPTPRRVAGTVLP